MSDTGTRSATHAAFPARRAAILQLANERGTVGAAEVFRTLVGGGLETWGAPGRNRTNSLIRSLLKTAALPAGSISYTDQSEGVSIYDLDEHIARLARDHAPIAPSDITRKLTDEGRLAGINVKSPQNVILRRLKHLRTIGTVKEEWLADGRLNADKEKLKAALPALLEQWQPIGVRGVFYQLVSAGHGPKDDSFLKRVGRALIELREDDLIPWEWISETGRTIDRVQDFGSLREGVEHFADYWYALNPWLGLEERVQI